MFSRRSTPPFSGNCNVSPRRKGNPVNLMDASKCEHSEQMKAVFLVCRISLLTVMVSHSVPSFSPICPFHIALAGPPVAGRVVAALFLQVNPQLTLTTM